MTIIEEFDQAIADGNYTEAFKQMSLAIEGSQEEIFSAAKPYAEKIAEALDLDPAEVRVLLGLAKVSFDNKNAQNPQFNNVETLAGYTAAGRSRESVVDIVRTGGFDLTPEEQLGLLTNYVNRPRSS